ncbi:MAG: helix-turn-helix transcriptional regulator [Chloroflexota bacterium]
MTQPTNYTDPHHGETPPYVDVEIAIASLIERVELQTGVRLTQLDISDATGIPQGTISKWANGTITRLDKHILVAFLNYFNRYFECRLDDLVVPRKQQELETGDAS